MTVLDQNKQNKQMIRMRPKLKKKLKVKIMILMIAKISSRPLEKK